MVIIKKGNILEATEDIVCHQCSTLGVFGGGLAYQIKQLYPLCEKETMEYVLNRDSFMGNYYLYVNKKDKRLIANCFTQNEDYTTNYDELRKCFTMLKNNCKDIKQTIAIPYKYGCGIANGNWETVESILIDIFTDYDLVVYKYDV